MAVFEITYTVKDDNGKSSSTAIAVPNLFSLSQYGEFAQSMALLMDAVIGGVIESAGLNVNVDISALTGNATAGASDVEEIGSFTFNTANGDNVLMNVPTIDELAEGANTNDLDQAYPSVAALISAVEDGIATTGGTIAPTDIGESDITGTVTARSEFANSGKRG